jgi:hypothetical protein
MENQQKCPFLLKILQKNVYNIAKVLQKNVFFIIPGIFRFMGALEGQVFLRRSGGVIVCKEP